MKTAIRVAAFVATHSLPEEALPWMAAARGIFDELNIFIDENRATNGTIANAQKVATQVRPYKVGTWYESDWLSLSDDCDADWLMILDYDEELSPEWRHQDKWRSILEGTDFTHFWIPRRWVVPGQRYITENPWWPEFQLRLFRNHLEGTIFPTKLHDHIQVPGPGACFGNLMIHHHVLTLSSRADRERKVQYYERLRPGRGLGHYYLYENYHPAEAPLSTLAGSNLNHEVIRMGELLLQKISGLSITLRSAVQEVVVCEMFWVDLDVTNTTNEPIYSCPPFPVRLSYHWIQESSRGMVVFDGERSGIFPCAKANGTTPWKMVVIAPSEPGKYVLQISMVQDGIRWFNDVNPDILEELIVSVRAEK